MNFRLVSKETKLARTVADPDLQIRGWGRGAVIQILTLIGKGGARSQKNFFSAPRAENKGGPGAPGPSPGSVTARKYLWEKISAH